MVLKKKPRRGRPPDPAPPGTPAMIRRQREKAHLSVDQAATAAGCDRSLWYRWEAGGRAPSIEQLGAAARVLGCSIVELIPEAD